ncbi:hypothetical protein DV737_g5156, partial [Chaetothyriales sp. CBS 132003]
MRITEQDSVAMVYLIFALGSQYYSDWGESGITQASKFYSIASTLLNKVMLQIEDQSLQRVQVMLLMTQYLNGVALEILYRKHPGNRENTERSQLMEVVDHDGEHQQNYLATPQTTGQVANSTLDNETGFHKNANQWLMDFDLSNPYDMSWFDVAPDLDPFIDQANFATASANWWATH